MTKAGVGNFIIVFAILTMALSLKAQIGVVGGMSVGAVKMTKIPSEFTNTIEGKNMYGFEAGIFTRPHLGPIYFKPELLYNFQKGNVIYKDQSGSISHNNNFTIHKLELPLLFGIRVLLLNFEAGPVFNYVLQATDNYNDNSVKIGKTGMGYRIGAGLDLRAILLNISYEGMSYEAGSDKATFKEPYKIIFGIGIPL